MKRSCIALAIGLAAVLTSCGGADEYTATSAAAADLHAVQVWDESAGLYFEGARSYVRIETLAEDELLEVELQPTDAGSEATIRLDPGEYRLVSWQRPCDGSCDSLDPPTDQCDERFVLAPETPLRASIEVRAGEGCTIAFD
jgi:hypothetical protein